MRYRPRRLNTRRPASFCRNSINLYRFIRLILGPDIADRQIARRWHLDGKNFSEFKAGRLPIPRLTRLEDLALILGVNKHLVFQVAGGTSARKVFDLIKKNDLLGQIRLLTNQLDKAHEALAKSEKLYRELFNNANDAIFVADIETGILLDCNKQAERLLGRSRNEIIGMHQSQVHPPEKRKHYKDIFKYHVRKNSINDLNKSEIIKKDGSVVPVYISARVMEIDGRKVIQGIFRDITQGENK